MSSEEGSTETLTLHRTRQTPEDFLHGIWVDTEKQLLCIRWGSFVHDQALANGRTEIILPEECESLSGLSINAYSRSWRTPLAVDDIEEGLTICGAGWVNNIWHDGPILCMGPAHKVEAFLPAGSSASVQIQIPFSDSSNYSLAEVYSPRDQTKSRICEIIEASLADTISQDPLIILLDDLSKESLVSLVMIVRAIGIDNITCRCQSKDPKIKRLCQNLGIKLENKKEGRPIREFSSLIAPHLFEDLYQALHSITGILPKTLFKH